MHRKYIRATVGTAEFDIPIGTLTDGQFLRFTGGQITSAAAVTGPASSVLNQVATWGNASGTQLLATPVKIDASGNVTLVAQINGIVPETWVVGPASAVNNRIALFNGTSGKLIKDGGLLVADLVSGSGTSTAGNIASFTDSTGRVITDGGKAAVALVTGPATATSNAVPTFSGTNGRAIVDSGITFSDIVRRAVTSSVSGNVPQYFGTGGNLIFDTGIAAASLMISSSISPPVAGNLAGAASATVIRDTGININNVVQNNATVTTNSVVKFADSTGRNITGAGFLADNVVQKAVSSVLSGDIAMFFGTTGNLVTDSGIASTWLPLDTGASATVNAIVKYTNTSKIITSSGILIDASNNVTGMGTLNTRTIANWVDGPASAVTGRIAQFNGTTGKLIADSGVLVADVVTGPASVTSNRLASFAGSTGKAIQQTSISESAGALSGIVSLNGITMALLIRQTSGFTPTNTDQVLAYDSTVSPYPVSYRPVTIDAAGNIQHVGDISVSTINSFNPSSHANRHYDVSGGDSILQTAVSWTTNDVLRYSGAQFDPKHMQIKVLGSNTITSSFSSVTNSSVQLAPRSGGNYVVRYKFQFNQSDSTGNLQVAVTWTSGTCVALVEYGVSSGQITSSGSTVSFSLTSAPASFSIEIDVSVVSPTSNCTIGVQVAKSSGLSASIPSGGTVMAFQA